LVLASAASLAGVHFAIVATAAILWAGTSMFALTPEVRATTRAPGEVERTTGAGALRAGGVRTLLCVSVALGIAFGATEIGIVAFAGGHHANGTLGLLYAAWSISSLAAGLWTARRVRLGDPVRRVVLLLLAMAGGSALLTLAPSVPGLAVGLLIAGAPVAP